MNAHRTMLAILMLTAGVAGCDRPTVVNAPPAGTVVIPAPVPGPPGPQGDPGRPGQPGQPGSSPQVVIVPAPSASEPK